MFTQKVYQEIRLSYVLILEKLPVEVFVEQITGSLGNPEGGSRISQYKSDTHISLVPGCLLWCVRTDKTCLRLTAVNWSNILAVCDTFYIMFRLILPSEQCSEKQKTKITSTSGSVQIKLCTCYIYIIPTSITILNWPNIQLLTPRQMCSSDQQTHTRKELASGFPVKAFYYPRQTSFSFTVY